MSIAASAWARKQKTGSATMKAVLIAVADYADEHGCAWPSQKRLAEDTELSARSVRDALAGLAEKGFLRREMRFRDDGSRASDRIFLACGGGEAAAGGGERASGGVGKDVPGGGERASPLTTFEPSLEPSEEPLTPASGRKRDDAEFDEWYSGYPHKVGKPAARKAFTSARRKASLETLITGRDRYIREKPPDRSWCNPATWLNQERWNDEPSYHRNGSGRPAKHHHGGPRGFDAVAAGVANVARQRGLTDPGGSEDLESSTRSAEPVDAEWWPARSH